MAETRDILLDENFDLQIKNGDFVVGESDDQNIQQLLLADKGSLKHAPTTGVGIRDAINGNNIDGLRSTINKEMTRDGYDVKVLSFESGQLDIDAEKQEFEEDNQFSGLKAVPKTLFNTFYIEISDDEGTVDPNKYRRIYLNLGTYYSIDEQYAYPDQDGYESLSIEQGLIKVRVDDSLTDYVPGLVRGDFLFIDENEQAHEITALPVCFVVHNS